jgi:hypothetical protein
MALEDAAPFIQALLQATAQLVRPGLDGALTRLGDLLLKLDPAALPRAERL